MHDLNCLVSTKSANVLDHRHERKCARRPAHVGHVDRLVEF